MQFHFSALFKNTGQKIPGLPFSLLSGEEFSSPDYYSSKNTKRKAVVSYYIAKAIALMNATLRGIGLTANGNVYVELESDTNPGKRYPVYIDINRKAIYHEGHSRSVANQFTFCYHVVQALVATYVARHPFDTFTKMFHLPNSFSDRAKFVKMCDEFYFCLRDMQMDQWTIELADPTKLGFDLTVQTDLMKDVMPQKQASSFHHTTVGSGTSGQTRRKCEVCGRPLKGRQKKFCSDCKHDPTKASVAFSTGPSSSATSSVFSIKVFGDPSKDLPDSLKQLIPKREKRLFLPERTRRLIEAAVNMRANINLIGEPGTGKTLTAYAIAYAAQLPLITISMSGGTEEDRFQGEKVLRNGTIDFDYSAMALGVRYGGVIHIDEWRFAPAEVMGLLNSLLDDRRHLELTQNNGEIIEAHPNTIIILSQNPSNDARFAGYQDGNEATDDRTVPIRFDFLPEDMEVQMLLEETGFSDETLVCQLVKLANTLRAMKRNNELHKVCTPRALRDVIRFVDAGIPLEWAIETAIVHRLAVDETEEDAIIQAAQRVIPKLLPF